METALILKSDVLDIVFENRNKSYGAYNLRKFYDNRLMKSLAGMIALVIILSAFTLIPKKKPVADDTTIVTTLYAMPPVKKDKPKEPEKQTAPQQPKQKAATTTFTAPVIVKDPEQVKLLVTISDTAVIASVTTVGEPGGHPIVGDPVDGPAGGGGATGGEIVKTEIAPDVPRETADFMPSYPGGIDALRKFLQRNLTNPKEMEENEEVAVKIRFVVGYNGKLQSFVTVQDGGEEFNKEVIRVLKKMPEWIPGKSNGQNVAVYYTIPVKFVAAN